MKAETLLSDVYEGKIVGAKAFDKVDHGILFHKLRDSGITGRLGMWFSNFLSDQCQFVRVCCGCNTVAPVISGVPQWTVLCPPLFLILMTDIFTNVPFSIVSFADDTKFGYQKGV